MKKIESTCHFNLDLLLQNYINKGFKPKASISHLLKDYMIREVLTKTEYQPIEEVSTNFIKLTVLKAKVKIFRRLLPQQITKSLPMSIIFRQVAKLIGVQRKI